MLEEFFDDRLRGDHVGQVQQLARRVRVAARQRHRHDRRSRIRCFGMGRALRRGERSHLARRVRCSEFRVQGQHIRPRDHMEGQVRLQARRDSLHRRLPRSQLGNSHRHERRPRLLHGCMRQRHRPCVFSAHDDDPHRVLGDVDLPGLPCVLPRRYILVPIPPWRERGVLLQQQQV